MQGRLRHLIDDATQSARQVSRALLRSPAFAVSAFSTLLIGMTACIAIFVVIDGILLRPLPYKDPDRLVGAWHDMPPVNLYHTQQSVTTYFTYRTQTHTIDGIGIYKETSANVSVPGQATDPQRLEIANASATLFNVLGVPALVGRAYDDEDDAVGAAPVALISEGVWHATFGADPHTVGRLLDVNGVSRRIVGVMPSSFRIPSAQTAVWIPLNVDPAASPADAFAYSAIARLKRGGTVADAQRDFATVLPRVSELYPKFVPGITTRQIMEQARPIPVLTPLRDDITGGVARTLWVVGVSALLLFLVACLNAGNLTLVRFEARQRELAVRQALGAGHGRLARLYVSETALITTIATACSLLLAQVAVRLLVSKGPADIPRLSELTIDGRAGVFALVLSCVTIIIVSGVPMLRLRRGFVLAHATEGRTRTATAGRGAHRMRRALVAGQVAMALVVLCGSGLLFRSFRQLHAVRLGFDPDHVATFWLSLPKSRYADDTALKRFYSVLLHRAEALPGVAAAGLASRLPLVNRGINPNPIYPEGAASYDTKLPPLVLFTAVGGDYFRALAIPLLAGRGFDDIAVQRPGDAIISSRTAALFWNDPTGRAAIGKRFKPLPSSPWVTVIGVVGDACDTTLLARPSPVAYFPEVASDDHVQHYTSRTMALTIRTQGDAETLTYAIQRAVHDADPSLPVFGVQSMRGSVRASTSRLEFTIIVLGATAMLTLLLGAIGLYGVMTYVVTLRRRELGIRIALGATPRSVAAAMTGDALTLALFGIAAGLLLYSAAAQSLRALLFGVTAWDPLTIVAASVTLLAMSLVATWRPAYRAARVDPVEVLRAE
jgi:predicted permease